MIIWYVSAVALGILVAFFTVYIYQRIASPGSTKRYWGAVASGIHGLLHGEEEEFWTHYFGVIKLTGRYVVNQLLAVMLAFAPLVLLFYSIAPLIFTQWDKGAPVSVFPPTAGVIDRSAPDGTGDGQETVMALTLRNGERIQLPDVSGSIAICPPESISCLFLIGFGFTIVQVDEAATPVTDLIVVRSDHADWNPIWPYLSDPEFLFFLSLIIGSGFLFNRTYGSSEEQAQSYSIQLIDYLLTQIASRNTKLARKLGDLETTMYKRKLAAFSVSKPIFISGLARSGTTILLEKLASVDGVATHRYRDFPFVMTPLIWDKFLRVFGTKQAPAERPHQDKIKITRDSPDAFEEPIWQHFFPFLHEPAHSHVLTGETHDETFEEFYSDHLKKMLFLRRGNRYLSKGNYNLTRIEYLARCFTDAVFLVPIRHPYTHVESLVRQHQIFCDYASEDPKIPSYLRAVGHYEFGPQRVPIHVTEDGAKSIGQAWERGDDMRGYALQWRDIYRYVASLYANHLNLTERIHLIRFEDLCLFPQQEFEKVVKFVELGDVTSAEYLAQGIEKSDHPCSMTQQQREECWEIVVDVATLFGYGPDLDTIEDFSGRPRQ